MDEPTVTIEVEGRTVTAESTCSIVEAIWSAGHTLVTNVGCLGQGVCGSCRVMVNRAGSTDVETALACETLVGAGMRVAFVAHLTPSRAWHLEPGRVRDSWELADELNASFPEAADCRHCGGCNAACPRGLDVHGGVALAVDGRLAAAAEEFDHCVMCGLCTEVCPESIDPNHLGLWARRVTTSSFVRPANLMIRLRTVPLVQDRNPADGPASASHRHRPSRSARPPAPAQPVRGAARERPLRAGRRSRHRGGQLAAEVRGRVRSALEHGP